MALQEQMYELFLLDRQVRGMLRRVDSATRRLEKQKTKLSQCKQQRSELADQLKHSQVKASDLENQIRGQEERIDHLRTQMNSVTNNKEYSAFLQEINNLKTEKSGLEDDTLNQMAEVDRIKQQLQEIDSQIDAQSSLVKRAQDDVKTCEADIGPQLETLKAQHILAHQKLPAEAQSIFIKLQDTHDGEALAVVTEENKRTREYACGGCYITIPVERVNTLMVHHDQIVNCPNCGRILYLDQDLKTSIGSK